MPDTVVRDGWAIGVAVYLNPFTLHSVGHEARAEACAVVAGCSIACSAIARTLAADYDTDDPDGTDADELALLVLTIRATRRAALHIQTLAEEATP